MAWTGWCIWADGRTRYPRDATSSDRWRSRPYCLCAATTESSTGRLRMQNTARRVPDRRSDLPPLPSRVMSLDGQLVDTTTVCWRFRSSSDGGKVILIPWDRLDEPAILSDRARYFAKLFLADKISRKK